MHKLVAYLLACVAAAGAPLAADARPAPPAFVGWPTQLDGRPLTRLPDTPEELRFYVGEHIRDGKGRTFPSMEAWHLAQALRTTEPPYLGVSVVELE